LYPTGYGSGSFTLPLTVRRLHRSFPVKAKIKKKFFAYKQNFFSHASLPSKTLEIISEMKVNQAKKAKLNKTDPKNHILKSSKFY
jgi:hypothetical protein